MANPFQTWTLNYGLRYEFLWRTDSPEWTGPFSLWVDWPVYFGPTPVWRFIFILILPVGRSINDNEDRSGKRQHWSLASTTTTGTTSPHRLGFAYSPKFTSGPIHFILGGEGKSSIRGGYSISYLRDGLTVVSNVLGRRKQTNPWTTGKNRHQHADDGRIDQCRCFRLQLRHSRYRTTDAANFAINSGNLIENL